MANWTKAFGYERPALFAHTWSLSIEEQFYLLWPVTLGLLLKRRISPGSLVRLLVCGIYLVIVLRVLMVTAGVSFARVFHGTDTRADALFMGCLLAVLTGFQLGRMRALQPWVLSLAGLCGAATLVAFCFRWDFHRPLAQAVFYPLTSLAACVLLLDLLLSKHSFVRAFLLCGPLVWVGKMSYGLYLWHVPVFSLLIKPNAPWHNAWIGLLIAAAATILSYYIVELPCLKLKNRRRAALFPRVQPLCPPVKPAG